MAFPIHFPDSHVIPKDKCVRVSTFLLHIYDSAGRRPPTQAIAGHTPHGNCLWIFYRRAHTPPWTLAQLQMPRRSPGGLGRI